MGKATVGQIVEVKEAGYHGFSTGTKAKVIEADVHGDGSTIAVTSLDGGICQYIEHGDYTIISAQPKFKSGDLVRGKATGYEYTLAERRPDQDGSRHGFAWSAKGMPGWVGEEQLELVVKESKGDDKMAKFNEGDRVKVDCSLYNGLATVIENRGSYATTTAYLVDTDGTHMGGRPDGYLFVYEGQLELVVKQPKFKVGDIVTGRESADAKYVFTTSAMTKGKVVSVDDDYIDVKVVEHQEGPGISGTYSVKAEHFELVTEVEPEAADSFNGISVGDYVVVKKEVEDALGSELEVGKAYEVERVDTEDDELPFLVDGYWVGATHVAKPKAIKMTKDDWADGYSKGDIFELEEDGDSFIDRDGDTRSLDAHEFSYLLDISVPYKTTEDDVKRFLTKLTDTELFDLIEQVRG